MCGSFVFLGATAAFHSAYMGPADPRVLCHVGIMEKKNGNYYRVEGLGLALQRDNGKENGSYFNGLNTSQKQVVRL